MSRLKIFPLALVAVTVLGLTGCPKSTRTERAQITRAIESASTVLDNFQRGEALAFSRGMVSPDDHAFIQKQLLNLATMKTTANKCVVSSSTNAAAAACIDQAMNTVNKMNADGTAYLKSTTAKTQFQIATTGVAGTLSAIKLLLSSS